jgi:hypothetical protein
MKRLVAQLEVEHPNVRNSILRALGNVSSRHLLSRSHDRTASKTVKYLTEVK